MNSLINQIRQKYAEINFKVRPKKERIIRKRMYIEGLRARLYQNYYMVEQIEARLIPLMGLGLLIFSVIGLTKGFMIFPQAVACWVVILLLSWWGAKKSKEIDRRIRKETGQTQSILNKLNITDREYRKLPEDCRIWVFYTEELVDRYKSGI